MKNKWFKVGALLAAAWLVAACSVPGGKLQGPAGGFTALQTTQANEAVLVFFREGGSDARVPLVLANDRVVGSLLADRYAQARVCAGALMAGTADRAETVGVPRYQALTAQAGQVIYLQVNDNPAGPFSVTPVPAEQARQRLDKLQMASHIINRHVPDCTPKQAAVVPAVATPPVPVVVPTVPVVLKRVQLGADALFQFDKSGEKDMLPKGRDAVDALAREIRAQGVQIERLRVVGHTDRLGTEAYNLKLSQARADTVVARLRAGGLAMPIAAEGRGEQEPVTTQCEGQQASKALVACLQPDRRVAIELIGSVPQTGGTLAP
ncbi:OmpA family protein [Hydrogenophaga sp. OTU3427]|uniref:OmpA family protein n=1 Tax=Hydrogenophaga sp. OTU3427 TaxID=3043856 RepID=UPI00313DD765